MGVVFKADLDRMGKVIKEEMNHPERIIDDTNFWEIRNDVRVVFWKKPCKHAVNVVQHASKFKLVDRYEATLPRIVVATAQEWVDCTVCLDCLLEEGKK